MSNYECDICGAKFSTKHSMLTHQINEHYTRNDDIRQTIEKAKKPLDTNLDTKIPDPFDQIEKQMAQQLRILQMRQMMLELKNGTPTQENKKSELEMFKDFTQIQQNIANKEREREEAIKDQILDEMEDYEAGTPEDRIFMKVIDNIFTAKRQAQNPPAPPATPPTPKTEETPKEVKGFVTGEQYAKLKEMIKDGRMTKERARELAYMLSDEEFNKYWEELKLN